MWVLPAKRIQWMGINSQGKQVPHILLLYAPYHNVNNTTEYQVVPRASGWHNVDLTGYNTTGVILASATDQPFQYDGKMISILPLLNFQEHTKQSFFTCRKYALCMMLSERLQTTPYKYTLISLACRLYNVQCIRHSQHALWCEDKMMSVCDFFITVLTVTGSIPRTSKFEAI